MTSALDQVLVTWAGHLGVAIYVAAYAALQAGLLRGTGYAYATLNLVAAALVLVSLSQAFNLSAAAIQIFWIAISVVGILRYFLLNHRIRFSDEERRMLDDVLPDMPKPLARRLLRRGVWSGAMPGVVLTREGEPVTHLHYMLSGRARVLSGGAEIAVIRHGFVGEMNVLEAGPASATVEINAPSRLFTISGDSLRALCRADSELRLFLEQWLSAATRRKLVEANMRLSATGAEKRKA